MRKIDFSILFFILLISNSCTTDSNRISRNDFEYSIEIDTVYVDSGEDIILSVTPKAKPGYADDYSKLYMFDGSFHVLEVFNLDTYSLEDKYQFESEGPNGLFNYGIISVRESLKEGEGFVFQDFSGFLGVKKTGEVEVRFKFADVGLEEGLNGNNFSYLEVLDFSRGLDVIVGWKMTEGGQPNEFYLINGVESEKTKLDLKNFSKVEELYIYLEENGSFKMNNFSIFYASIIGENIIFSNSSYNDAYVYNLKERSLKFHEVENTLHPSKPLKSYKGKYSNEIEYKKAEADLSTEIHFSKFYHDQLNNKYVRFATLSTPIEGTTKSKSRKFINIFNEDLELIYEEELGFTFSIYHPVFVKDGMVHIFLNHMDEMAFIRLSLE